MFSFVVPMDMDRLEQFTVTKLLYDKMPQKKEFIVPTRSSKLFTELKKRGLTKDLTTFLYTLETPGFNCSRALNLGVRTATYNQIIITSPEVMPTTDVLAQLEELQGQNVVCQVFDEDPEGSLTSLVHHGYRDMSPAMYFLAMFNKTDIQKINGWDEDFLKGYAYEDDDFGARWVRAGIPFTVREDIHGIHQYHPRNETVAGGTGVNFAKYTENNNAEVVYCKNGIIKS